MAKADFFELGGDRAGVQNSAEMGPHGGEGLGSVGHYAEHVGQVAAPGKALVVEGGHSWRDFAAFEAGDAGQGPS